MLSELRMWRRTDQEIRLVRLFVQSEVKLETSRIAHLFFMAIHTIIPSLFNVRLYILLIPTDWYTIIRTICSNQSINRDYNPFKIRIRTSQMSITPIFTTGIMSIGGCVIVAIVMAIDEGNRKLEDPSWSTTVTTSGRFSMTTVELCVVR